METKRSTEDNVLIRHAMTIAIGGVTLVMLLMAVISWRQNEASEEAQKRLSHTYEVSGHMGLLFTKLKYAEMGQRVFILTGNADHLEPYNAALKDGTPFETGQRSLQPHRSIHQELRPH
ncbi:MAG: CHASE3 domain-containing protein [Nitrospira sp.]